MMPDLAHKYSFELAIEDIAIKAARAFQKQHNVDLRQDALASIRLREEAIKMVKRNERVLLIPFITATSSGPKHMEISFSGHEIRKARKHMEDACE